MPNLFVELFEKQIWQTWRCSRTINQPSSAYAYVIESVTLLVNFTICFASFINLKNFNLLLLEMQSVFEYFSLCQR